VSPAEQAARALRRGDPVLLGGLPVRAVETASEGGDTLLITCERAVALKLANQRAAASALASGTAVALAGPFGAWAARDIADPTRDLAEPLKGPFHTVPVSDPIEAAAALRLAKIAGLLPAVFADTPDPDPDPAVAITVEDVLAFDRAPTLRIVGRARLPVQEGPGELIAFRSDGGGPEHLALLLGTPDLNAPVLTRLHSSCLTGDILGSRRCDCGPQLHAAMARLAIEGGVLLYLQQEGRGIGLVNKLRAYELQDQGFDTLDANERLGFAPDERDFRLAAAMLRALGAGAVRLLTNNPAKVAALEAAGVPVVERVPLAVGQGADNAAYLATKRARAGHLF
jgi:GTP cyclohydrolase II